MPIMTSPHPPPPPGAADVWIAGATGLVGGALLARLLGHPEVGTATALVRRSTGRSHARLREAVIDFERLDTELNGRSVCQVFCCLGTTIAAAGSQAAFRRVDHDYPLALARGALRAGARKFLVVTALGADPRSRLFYNRVKGELEQELRSLGIPEVHVFRPSLLLGERAERRRGERWAEALLTPLSTLMVGPLRKYRPISASDVAAAMVRVAFPPATPPTPSGPATSAATGPSFTIHDSDQIAALAANELRSGS